MKVLNDIKLIQNNQRGPSDIFGILVGQLILKEGNFSVFNSKNELENVNFCPSQLGQKFFVRFWEN